MVSITIPNRYSTESFYTDLRDSVKRFFKRFEKREPRIFNPERDRNYDCWKLRTFGYNTIRECERKTQYHTNLFYTHNNDVKKWYQRRER